MTSSMSSAWPRGMSEPKILSRGLVGSLRIARSTIQDFKKITLNWLLNNELFNLTPTLSE